MLQTLVLRMRLLLVLAVPLWEFGFLLLLFLHFSTLLDSPSAHLDGLLIISQKDYINSSMTNDSFAHFLLSEPVHALVRNLQRFSISDLLLLQAVSKPFKYSCNVYSERVCRSRRRLKRRSAGNVPAGKRDEKLGKDQKNKSLVVSTAKQNSQRALTNHTVRFMN